MRTLLLTTCCYLAFLLLAPACAPTKTATLSLRNLSCASCGGKITADLERKSGVRSARFLRDPVEVKVVYDPSRTTPVQLLSAVKKGGYDAILGAGRGSYEAPAKFTASMDVKVISRRGEKVDLTRHLVPGKVTVFDFYAVWCGPCRDVDRTLARLLKERSDFAVRKINVVSWTRPVARQHLKGIAGLPFLMIYDAQGRLRQRLAGKRARQLRAALEAVLGRRGRTVHAAPRPTKPGGDQRHPTGRL